MSKAQKSCPSPSKGGKARTSMRQCDSRKKRKNFSFWHEKYILNTLSCAEEYNYPRRDTSFICFYSWIHNIAADKISQLSLIHELSRRKESHCRGGAESCQTRSGYDRTFLPICMRVFIHFLFYFIINERVCDAHPRREKRFHKASSRTALWRQCRNIWEKFTLENFSAIMRETRHIVG